MSAGFTVYQRKPGTNGRDFATKSLCLGFVIDPEYSPDKPGALKMVLWNPTDDMGNGEWAVADASDWTR